MTQKNLMGLLVSIFVLLAASAQFAVADLNETPFGRIVEVEVNGVDVLDSSIDLHNLAGRTVPVFVRFDADESASEVVIRVWVSGERQDTFETEEFNVVAGGTYSRFLFVTMPNDLDELDETRRLEVEVESDDGKLGARISIPFSVDREPHNLEILSIHMASEVRAGELVPIDVVLKNRGMEFEDDVFLRIRIPELGIETRSFFGDIPPIDNFLEETRGIDDEDDEDAVERRAFLRVPVNARPGLYSVEFQAFSDDALSEAERKVLVVGVEADTLVVSPQKTKAFGVRETEEYELTIVNKGDLLRVFELALANVPSELSVELSESTVAVDADERGNFDFSVNVHSEDGALISKQTFRAEVDGKDGARINFGDNATLLLTVVLAIVFVVLLVVLIVLLTRKPGKEEAGEKSSYY